MKTALLALALLATTAIAAPVEATTFPSLKTIYIGSGVRDSANGAYAGIATVVHCSNVSGLTTTLRMQFLHKNGSSAGLHTFNSVAHGSTVTLVTHAVVAYVATELNVLQINSGLVNVESTQSAVFCNASVVDASAALDITVPIPLVRVNPHPGTAE